MRAGAVVTLTCAIAVVVVIVVSVLGIMRVDVLISSLVWWGVCTRAG